MAFSSAITGRSKMANKNVTFGTWEDDGDQGGDINTGLTVCEFIVLTPQGIDKVSACTESLPAEGSAITIDNEGDVDGYWMAIGR